MLEQVRFFLKDVGRIIGKKKYRILMVVFTRSFWGLFVYRLERGGYLLFGKYYAIVRFPFIPVFFILQSFSNIDIHYTADIKGGVLILHPSLGIVVSGRATVGENLTLTGGNVIGFNAATGTADFSIGNGCTLGANAVIIGALILGDGIQIGASACVTKSFAENEIILVGVPAKKIK